MDANAVGLREFSGRASREHLTNAVFVRAAIENLPPALAGVADRVTIVLPWGSLLAAVIAPSLPVLRAIRALCARQAVITVVIGGDPIRDRAETERLGLPVLPLPMRQAELAAGWAAAGFALGDVREIDAADLAAWPSTWAKRLAHGLRRRFWRLDARASRLWD